MPTIPIYTPGAVPDPAEFYSQSLFSPQVTPQTFEVLQGGLDQDNLGGTIPGWAVKSGSFVRYAFRSFRNLSWVYARQSVGDGVGKMVHPLLALTFALPWDASLVRFGWHAWCRQDATRWDHDADSAPTTAGAPPWIERWHMLTELDGADYPGCTGRLPEGRGTVSHYMNPPPAGDPDPPFTDPGYDPGYQAENRWRHFAAQDQVENLSKGRHSLRVYARPRIFGEDLKIAKLLIPSGGIWMMAYR